MTSIATISLEILDIWIFDLWIEWEIEWDLLGFWTEVVFRGRQLLAIGFREQLTLNQRATGSIPVRPTNKINDLRHSCPDPVCHKTCYRSVSGNRAAAFFCIPTTGIEFFDYTGSHAVTTSPKTKSPCWDGMPRAQAGPYSALGFVVSGAFLIGGLGDAMFCSSWLMEPLAFIQDPTMF